VTWRDYVCCCCLPRAPLVSDPQEAANLLHQGASGKESGRSDATAAARDGAVAATEGGGGGGGRERQQHSQGHGAGAEGSGRGDWPVAPGTPSPAGPATPTSVQMAEKVWDGGGGRSAGGRYYESGAQNDPAPPGRHRGDDAAGNERQKHKAKKRTGGNGGRVGAGEIVEPSQRSRLGSRSGVGDDPGDAGHYAHGKARRGGTGGARATHVSQYDDDDF
jgi:hypothetical protein